VTVKGFYDDVQKVSSKERKAMNTAPYDEKQYMKDLGVSDLMGEKGFTTVERTGIRPTLDVNGIWGGYIGEGAKTVLPSKAFAKISMRLVPDQDPKKIEKMFQKHFEGLAPKSVKVKVTAHHGGYPVVVPNQLGGVQSIRKSDGTSLRQKAPAPARRRQHPHRGHVRPGAESQIGAHGIWP
jgi:acetylornithine deacetylase/succinyl-diaminopimelate desuccinylase-like protein